MLDDFQNEQSEIYNMIINSIKNDKISHAYLIEKNDYTKSFEFSIAFAKSIICPNKYTNDSMCKNCNNCLEIDNNEFLELKIIEADGQWIKKSQLDELQQQFSKKSIIGKRKVYIIKEAEKLNASSANSLLKFLEEPEEGITAILLCSNISRLLPTIVSRCQIYSLNSEALNKNLSTFDKIANFLFTSREDINNYLSMEENKNKLNKTIEFIKFFEENGLNTIIYVNKIWHTYFKEREEIYNAFQIMILFYKDIINFLLNKDIEVFNDYIEELKKVANINTIDSIISKIDVIINLQSNIKNNVNNSMLMDKLIISLDRSK